MEILRRSERVGQFKLFNITVEYSHGIEASYITVLTNFDWSMQEMDFHFSLLISICESYFQVFPEPVVVFYGMYNSHISY